MLEFTHLFNEFKGLLLSLNRKKLKEFISNLENQYSSKTIINKLIIPALEHIGVLWESGDVALSQVYMSGKLCREIINEMFPKVETVENKGLKIGIAVLEDYHTLAMHIINSFLRTSGIKPIVYEIGIKVNSLIDKVKEDKIDVLLISTLMLRAALKIKKLTTKLRESGEKCKIIVGGAPFLFNDELWKEVGADSFGKNAFEAIKLINNIVEES